MLEDVERKFDEYISTKFASKPDVMKYLLTHERKNLCLDNLCEQIQIAQRASYKITFEVDEYTAVIESIANLFASRALQHAEESRLSSIEKIRRQTEADKDKELDGIIREFVKDGAIIDRDPTDLKLGAEDDATRKDQTEEA